MPNLVVNFCTDDGELLERVVYDINPFAEPGRRLTASVQTDADEAAGIVAARWKKAQEDA